MKHPTRYLPALLLLLLPLLFASCMREDLSDCPTGIRIYFTYESVSADKHSNPAEVEKIDLFVFDAQGAFHSVWTDNHPIFSPDYYMTITDLPVGDYRFVAWAGLRDSYSIHPANLITKQTPFNDVQLIIDHISTGIENNFEHFPIFHAVKKDYVHYKPRIQRIDLPLKQVYNTINLTTEGLPLNGDIYRLALYDHWDGRYKFDGSFAAVHDVTFATPCGKDAQGQLLASLRILRLTANRHPLLVIYNVMQQREFYQMDLIALLRQIGNLNFETTHTYNIHIKFSTGMKTTITINGWNVTEWETMPY